MSTKKKISIGILTLVCGAILVFAFEVFLMASKQQLMPMMEKSIGKTSAEINEYSPELLSFLFTPIKLSSALMLSLVVGILILIYGPYRTDSKWAATTIFTILLVWLLLALFIYSSQPNAPWQLWLILLILVLLALSLNLTDKNKSN